VKEHGRLPEEEETLTVVVADDDPLARRMIRDVLGEVGLRVVAEAFDGQEAVELVRLHRPDVALLDVMMPKLDGVAATRAIIADNPEQVVVLLTHAANDAMGLTGLRAGAAGYLPKDVDLSALPRALVGAVAGQAAISRELAMRLIEQLRDLPPRGHGLRPVESALTAREWQVLDLLCERRTTAEIADELVLARETVRTYIKSVLRKLDARSRAEAVEIARRIRGLPE
jgi:NarL family two-component system response regulator LiaR